jgi:predicted RNase H-like nuclease (RuvC/YqgF family)
MTAPCERHCEATAFKIAIKNLEWVVKQRDREIHRLKAELDEVYGLLSHAHTELRSQLEHGYHIPAIKSTLISVGRYAPKLKAKMDELQAKMGDKL